MTQRVVEPQSLAPRLVQNRYQCIEWMNEWIPVLPLTSYVTWGEFSHPSHKIKIPTLEPCCENQNLKRIYKSIKYIVPSTWSALNKLCSVALAGFLLWCLHTALLTCTWKILWTPESILNEVECQKMNNSLKSCSNNQPINQQTDGFGKHTHTPPPRATLSSTHPAGGNLTCFSQTPGLLSKDP